MMNPMLIHNANILVRLVFYGIWAWVFYFDGLELSVAMQSFLNCLVLADVVTWLLYQLYLLPRLVLQFGLGTVVNLVVTILLIRNAKNLVPQTVDMQALAIMVFFSVAAVKGFYYLLLEMGSRNAQTSRGR